jgi:hypothetical protein
MLRGISDSVTWAVWFGSPHRVVIATFVVPDVVIVVTTARMVCLLVVSLTTATELIMRIVDQIATILKNEWESCVRQRNYVYPGFKLENKNFILPFQTLFCFCLYIWKTWLGNNVNVSCFFHLRETWQGNNVSWFAHSWETWLGNNVS